MTASPITPLTAAQMEALAEPADLEALTLLLAEATELAPLPWSAGDPWPEGWIMSANATLGRQVHVLDVRGWGYLTGQGDALKMNHDDAFEVQKKWGALVAAAVNAVGPLCEEIKRLRTSSVSPASDGVHEKWVRGAFEHGFELGKMRNRTIANPDGLEDAADLVVRLYRAALAKGAEADA